MVEHRTPNPRAGGSNPSWPANVKLLVSIQMASKSKGQGTKGKKTGTRNTNQDKQSSSFTPTAIRGFVHEVLTEFKKIVWPDKKVTFGLTGFVLILVVVISLYLGSVDLILGKIISSVLQ